LESSSDKVTVVMFLDFSINPLSTTVGHRGQVKK
jgi:hypothetical protein